MHFRVRLFVLFDLLHEINILQELKANRAQIPVKAAHWS